MRSWWNAARIGKQGRGYAVVVSKAGSPMQRSAEAAKDIEPRIGHSVEQVEHGTVPVDRAGKTIDDIVGSIQQATRFARAGRHA